MVHTLTISLELACDESKHSTNTVAKRSISAMLRYEWDGEYLQSKPQTPLEKVTKI